MGFTKNVAGEKGSQWSAVVLFASTLLFSSVLPLRAQSKETQFVQDNFDFAVRQTKKMLQSPYDSQTPMPHSLHKDGSAARESIYLWTAGFFPGMLWYLAEYTADNALKDSARLWTDKMEPVKTFTDNHDIGFMMHCPYGNAYRLSPNKKDKDILMESARSLSTRFSPVTGTIKSWNSWRSWNGDEVFKYPVIIDNMMNLELLFFASRVSGDKSFRKIAISHAEKTMKYQIRPDGGSFHIAFYNPDNGQFIKGETSQGYSDNSTWSRGQGWAIYGFTMSYRETKDRRFLETAIKTADYYVNNENLPSDKVAWWDFNAYQVGYKPGIRSNAGKTVLNYRDASAAALVASALFELSTYVKGEKSKKYFESAVQIVHTLGSPAYRANEGENGNFILKHSVGAIPHDSEIDVPLTYADYYFIEALARYNALLNKKPLPIFKG